MKRLLIIIALCLFAAPAIAQPLAEHVPDDALIYVGWAGTDELGETYENSKLKAVLDATQFAELFDEMLPAMMEQSNDPDAAQIAEQVRELIPVAWHRPWAFYLAGFEYDNDEPTPHIAMLCRAGEHDVLVRSQFEKMRDAILDNKPNAPVQIMEHDGVVGFVAGKTAGDTLTMSANYKAVAEHIHSDDALVCYVDVERWLATVDELLMAVDKNDELDLTDWHQIRNALGLDGLKQIAYSAGFEGTSWRSSLFIHAPSPRTGLLQLLDAKPIHDGELAIVPRSATWAQVSQIDLQLIYDVVIDAVGRVDPDAVMQWRVNLGAFGAQVGVDIEKLITQFGPRWVMYNDPGVAGPMGLGMCAINRPADPDWLAEQLTTLEDMANAMLDEQGQVGFRFKQIQSGRITIHSFAMPFLSPSWAIHNGNLYVTLFPQAIAMADIYAQQTNASLVNNPKFQTVRERIGVEGDVTALSFVDLEQTAPTSYSSYMMAMQTVMSLMPPEVAEQAPGMLLPPLGVILPHLEPAGTVGWVDDQGYHSRGVSPFPGSFMLSQHALTFGGGGPVMTATGVGILLPALQAARRTAREAQSFSNVRQITLGLNIYANDHDWKTPSRFSDLLVYLNENPSVFLHPSGDQNVPGDFETWDQKQKHNWIDLNSDYLLIPCSQRLDSIENPWQHIQIIEKPKFESNEMLVVGFADGHVERWLIMEIEETLIEQTGKTIDEIVAESERVE